MRILRIYHSGRDRGHRARARELAALGHDVVLVVPAHWPQPGAERHLSEETFRLVEVEVRRSADINRYAFREPGAIAELIKEFRPDILDVHEEPVSLATRQVLHVAPLDLPISMYTAQNIDKRYPPPFAQYERAALRRVAGMYPCSAQAAAVARGKGFDGPIRVIPLGYYEQEFHAGQQSLADPELMLALVGRFVEEKGLVDAVHALAAVCQLRPARLLLVGEGPELAAARRAAADLGIAQQLDVLPWQPASELAELYRNAHVVLVPSTATATWVEQFGRVIVEAQACGAVVVGYASGSIPEVGGSAAVLVHEGAVAELARRTAELVSDPVAWQQRRDAGLALVRGSTWRSVVEQLVDLYEEMLAAPDAGQRLTLSPGETRRRAVAEFGEPARLPRQERPFALPVLRQSPVLGRWFGAGIDVAAQLKYAASSHARPLRASTSRGDQRRVRR